MCSLSPPWIPLCMCMSAPHLSSLSLLFFLLFPYYEKEKEKIREGENANTPPWFFLVTDQASLHPPLSFCNWLRDDLPSIPLLSFLSPLHFEVFSPPVNPPLFPGPGATVRTAR